jgi:putative ABC transport system ATP-binding protein
VGLTAPAIEASNLYRFYHSGDDETFALRGVSLELHAGETVAVVGPSGSGKSTLLHCLAGLDDPDGGVVRVVGQLMSRQPESRRAALRGRYIGVLLQSGNLFDHLNARENMTIAAAFGGDARGSGASSLLLDAVGVGRRSHALPSQLSGGELARAGLAVALANEPPVLLADEPTGEVDSVTEAALLELFRHRARQGGANLIVTHSEGVAAIADRRLTMSDGVLSDA